MKQSLNIMCKMLLLLVASAHFTGCVAIVAGVGGAAIGGTAYAMGDLAVLVDASPEHLERAIKKGGRDMDLQYIHGSGDVRSGSYLFRDTNDQKITVTDKTMSPVYYELSIRVGTFGDEAMSQSLNQAIQKHL